MRKLPIAFVQQMNALLGTAAADFYQALASPAPVSIRLNKHKKGVFPESFLENPVPWHPQGFYLKERPSFTLDPLFQAGAYYVQEASSMFLQEAVRQTVNLDNSLKVLDLCAAPGGKSTLLLDMISSDSLLLANEVIRPRVNVLRENIEKWGKNNTAVSSHDAADFSNLEDYFDLMLVDAPCSGEGLFRKDPDAVGEWSAEQVKNCALRQQRILTDALPALAPGGVLIYSTCTYNSLENDENAAFLIRNFNLEVQKLETPASWNVTETRYGYQFFPHLTIGEGFYLSVFRKKGEATARRAVSGSFKQLKPLPKAQMAQVRSCLSEDIDLSFFVTVNEDVIGIPSELQDDFLLLDKYLRSKWFGLEIGAFKGKDFIPAQALAQSLWAGSNLPSQNLDLQQANKFMKKELFDMPENAPKGWVLITYQDLGLGWVKALPNRVNNYFPGERRIRMA